MDGLTGIAARMHAIQQQIQSLTPAAKTIQTTSTTTTASGTSTSTSQFAAALQQAQTTQGAAHDHAHEVKASGKLNGQGVPVELAKYGNGKIPANALESVGIGNHKMWAPAAENFKAMKAAAARDGVKIGMTDSYRSYESQVDLAHRKGLYSQGGLAAKPGTSEHGWGLSTDLDLDSKALTWMRKHAQEYGFKENVPREPWHWTYKP